MSPLKNRALRLLPRYPLLSFAPAASPTLYLTFDDGPHVKVTETLLDLLGEYDVKASFFCIGKNLVEVPRISSRIVEEGHLLSNHSYLHQQFSSLPTSAQLAEVEKTDELIEQQTGQRNRYFRAPQGRWSASLVFRLRMRGITPVHWTYDSADYTHDPPEEIQKRFQTKPVRNGDVILFHDDNQLCVEVLQKLIPAWISEGFGFRRIDQA